MECCEVGLVIFLPSVTAFTQRRKDRDASDQSRNNECVDLLLLAGAAGDVNLPDVGQWKY